MAETYGSRHGNLVSEPGGAGVKSAAGGHTAPESVIVETDLRRAANGAREVANAAIREAVEQVKVDLPVSIVGESVKASLEVVEAAALDEATPVAVKG